MAFTGFSVILLLAVGAAVFVEVVRGIKRGFVRSVVALASVLLSALGAIAPAVWLSDAPARLVANLVIQYIPQFEEATAVLPHIGDIVTAAVDALVTLVLFVIFFLLLRFILRMAVSVLFRTCWRSFPDDPDCGGSAAEAFSPGCPSYEGADAPWHRRHDRLLGGVTGGVCGFLAALMLMSPVLGILSVAGTLVNGMNGMNVKWSKLGLSADTVATVEPFVNDGAVAVLNAAGGELVFDAAATTTLNERSVSLRRETEACMAVMVDLVKVLKVITKVDTATEEQREIIQGLGARIDTSETLRILAADFLNGAAERWLDGRKFFSVSRPVCGELIDPIMDKALLVCMESDVDCVGRDITTVLNVYLIAAENGLVSDPSNEQLMEALDEGGVLDQIYAELKKNPCMEHLADELTYTALRIMASAIDWQDFSEEVYNGLMADLSEAMNLVNGMNGATFAEQVSAMTEYTLHYAEQYGISLPEGMAEMAATAMVEQLGGSGKLGAEDMDDFFSYYLNGE